MPTDEELLAQVNAVLKETGCVATDLGPNSVGVQGDGRVYDPVVFVTFAEGMNWVRIGEISNMITNQVPGITRVLMNVTRQQ